MVRRAAGRAAMQRTECRGEHWRGVFADGTLWWSDDPLEALPALAGWYLAA